MDIYLNAAAALFSIGLGGGGFFVWVVFGFVLGFFDSFP